MGRPCCFLFKEIKGVHGKRGLAEAIALQEGCKVLKLWYCQANANTETTHRHAAMPHSF